MPESPLHLIKVCAEFLEKERFNEMPKRLRGIYVLYNKRLHRGFPKYDMQYVGMATAGQHLGLRGRLSKHVESKRKGKRWTHFFGVCSLEQYSRRTSRGT
jgi:hypothetical protein